MSVYLIEKITFPSQGRQKESERKKVTPFEVYEYSLLVQIRNVLREKQTTK